MTESYVPFSRRIFPIGSFLAVCGMLLFQFQTRLHLNDGDAEPVGTDSPGYKSPLRVYSQGRLKIMSKENYIELLAREFKRLKSLADGAIVQCSDEQFFAAPAPMDNSVAVIVKHVAGNLISRWTDLLTSDGEKPNRNRDAEFEILPEDSRERLLALWAQGWSVLFASLSSLTDEDVSRSIRIRGEPLTVLQAVNRQLTHYSYHVGQIVYVAKNFCGASWKTLSIPRGGSARFNQQPTAYVPDA